VSPDLIEEFFRLKEIGEVGRAMYHPQGYAIPKLVETRLPKPPEFAEARAKVQEDFIVLKATELLESEAKRISQEAAKSKSLTAVAKSSGLKVIESKAFKRPDSPDPEIGTSPAFTAASFDLPVGGVSSPISLDGGARSTILRVTSRTPIDEAEYQKQKAETRERMLSTWRESYFQEYIRLMTESLEKAGKIRRNQKAMDMVTGLRAS